MDDIVVMGSNTVDIYVQADVDLIQISHPSHDDDTLLGYPLGHKVLADDARTAVGGSGVNAATAFQRCGFDTTYLGCLGDDMFGANVLEHIEGEGIAFQGSLGDTNGIGVILESQATDRTILSYKGCNNDLAREDVPDSLQPSWFYTSTVMGETRATMKQLITSFDETNTAVNASSYIAKEGIEGLKAVLEATDYLFVNREEARLLTGEKTIIQMLKALNGVVRGQTFITDGENGVYYVNEEPKHMMPQHKDVVDTSGAGDAFNAGFITAISQGKPVDEAVKAGMIQSEHIIQGKTTTENLLDNNTLLSELNDDTREPTVIR
jgi:ribokinase